MSDPDRLAAIRAQAEADDYDENSGVPGWYPQTVLLLVGEVEGLRTELAAALGDWQREAGAMIERGREIVRLRDLLARLEWASYKSREVGSSIVMRPCCPVCQGSEPDHRDGCELAAELHPDPEQAP